VRDVRTGEGMDALVDLVRRSEKERVVQ